VVIGGLLNSTTLTLLVVPVVYSLVDGVKQRLGFRPERAVPGEPSAEAAPAV
jgi:HAE1 family hydrophobic/amphiphilic exporter-1